MNLKRIVIFLFIYIGYANVIRANKLSCENIFKYNNLLYGFALDMNLDIDSRQLSLWENELKKISEGKSELPQTFVHDEMIRFIELLSDQESLSKEEYNYFFDGFIFNVKGRASQLKNINNISESLVFDKHLMILKESSILFSKQTEYINKIANTSFQNKLDLLVRDKNTEALNKAFMKTGQSKVKNQEIFAGSFEDAISELNKNGKYTLLNTVNDEFKFISTFIAPIKRKSKKIQSIFWEFIHNTINYEISEQRNKDFQYSIKNIDKQLSNKDYENQIGLFKESFNKHKDSNYMRGVEWGGFILEMKDGSTQVLIGSSFLKHKVLISNEVKKNIMNFVEEHSSAISKIYFIHTHPMSFGVQAAPSDADIKFFKQFDYIINNNIDFEMIILPVYPPGNTGIYESGPYYISY